MRLPIPSCRAFNIGNCEQPLWADSVEKLCLSGRDNFSRNFHRPAAQASDKMNRSELRQ